MNREGQRERERERERVRERVREREGEREIKREVTQCICLFPPFTNVRSAQRRQLIAPSRAALRPSRRALRPGGLADLLRQGRRGASARSRARRAPSRGVAGSEHATPRLPSQQPARLCAPRGPGASPLLSGGWGRWLGDDRDGCTAAREPDARREAKHVWGGVVSVRRRPSARRRAPAGRGEGKRSRVAARRRQPNPHLPQGPQI